MDGKCYLACGQHSINGVPGRYVLLILLLLWAPQLLSAEFKCPATTEIEMIDEGIYLRAGRHGVIFEQSGLANIGFIVGAQCVAVIDTGGSIEEAETLNCAIKEVTQNPVCYVINTHVHPDHTLGSQVFDKTGVSFIGHRNLPRALAMLGPTYLQRALSSSTKGVAPVELRTPDKLVKNSLTLDLGGRKLLLKAWSQAHTDNDLTIYDDKTATLWTGDLLFVDHIPVIGGSGSINGWLKVLPELKEITVRTLIPGHGPFLQGAEIKYGDIERYLATLRNETRAWLEEGGDLRAAPDKIGYVEKAHWPMFDHYHKRNVSYAYTELEWE